MKQSEKEIIKHLRKGKRVNISQIARELNLPISTVSDRIKRVEKRYIIKRSSLLDYHKMGYSVNDFLAIKIDHKKKKEILDFLKEQGCVNSIYYVNSGFDFLIEIICKDSMEVINWIEDIKTKFPVEILRFHILKTVEKERFVPK